jgi:hypothetical protein
MKVDKQQFEAVVKKLLATPPIPKASMGPKKAHPKRAAR